MSHHGEGSYVTGDYTSAEVTNRMLRRKNDRLEIEKDRIGNDLYCCVIERDKLRVEKTELVEALEKIQEKTHIHSSAMALEISTIAETTYAAGEGGIMKCVACRKEIEGRGKLINCDGDFVCDDKCHEALYAEMDRVCSMTDEQFEYWMDEEPIKEE